jgi:hypothetical protein
MNPYLEQEQAWHDFHQQFITGIAQALVPLVRPTYIVVLEEYVHIHERSHEERRLVGAPDVSIARTSIKSTGALSTTSLVNNPPVYLEVPMAVEAERLSYLNIQDRQSREIITTLELLSPSNKTPGADREQYIAKRRRILHSNVNFVEIDLLHGGPRMPMEGLPDCDYYAMVSRAEVPRRVGVWPIKLRERLPLIPVPLRAPDRDAVLDLQELLHRVFNAASYEDYIYTGNPDPPLHPQDAAWAKELIGNGSEYAG